eukprot:g62202.t1
MSKVAKLLGYRKHALGTVEAEVDKSDNWLELGAVSKDGKFCFSAPEGKAETRACDGKAETPAGDGKAETPAGDPQKDKKPDPATLCDEYYCRKTSNIRTPLDYRTPGTVKGEQQSRATTAILESMVCKNIKNLALYQKKIVITREGEDVWVVGVQSKLSKQFLNKGGRDITDLYKIILISRRVTVIDPIASELVGDVPDDEWDPKVPPLLVLMAPACKTPLEKLPVIYDFTWMQEQPGNGGTYVNGMPRRQIKPKAEPEAEPVSLTPPNEVEKEEKVESVRFAQQAQQIAELQKTVEALQSKVQPTPAITLLDQGTQLTTLTTNSSASSFNTSSARQKLYQKLGNQCNNVNSQNILQYYLMIEQQLLQEQNKFIRSQYLSSLF